MGIAPPSNLGCRIGDQHGSADRMHPQGAGYQPLQDERADKPRPRESIEREIATLKARIKRLESGEE